MERKVFEELLELKRMQIRAGRANEQLLVKRLSDNYAKTIQDLAGLKNYDGPFTFKAFEKYLYSKFFITMCSIYVTMLFHSIVPGGACTISNIYHKFTKGSF